MAVGLSCPATTAGGSGLWVLSILSFVEMPRTPSESHAVVGIYASPAATAIYIYIPSETFHRLLCTLMGFTLVSDLRVRVCILCRASWMVWEPGCESCVVGLMLHEFIQLKEQVVRTSGQWRQLLGLVTPPPNRSK